MIEEGLYYVAKTKKLTSCAVTAQLISASLFSRLQKNWFSYDVAHLIIVERTMIQISMLHFMLQKFVDDEVMKSKICML